ncbi:hypothetical protein DEU56DRAFT_898055 [Suillus clintonianus]|uniref:uncharacterized protein n=1 Tax=Suillus clintonianus TaxID=1904413 RepID=UPI001B86213A|nr:uncharacterized protein DEU56DRAFT_898055 [Suillus clintonianus]KAG2154070.1 hypothetical protein DEU56DRAFT_898055 [Suillus clintonianus]
MANADSAHALVELITAPALGPEWQLSGMKTLTKSGRQEIKSEKRQEKWKPSIAGRRVCAESGSPKSTWPSSYSGSSALYSQSPSLEHLLIQVDTTANIISLTFNYISAEVRDPTANLQVGTAYFGKDTLPPSHSKMQVSLNFLYIASNDWDSTWNACIVACMMLSVDTVFDLLMLGT